MNLKKELISSKKSSKNDEVEAELAKIHKSIADLRKQLKLRSQSNLSEPTVRELMETPISNEEKQRKTRQNDLKAKLLGRKK
jgi:hypothetical protein